MTIDIEAAVTHKFPRLAHTPPLFRNSAVGFLRRIVHEREINEFLRNNLDATGFHWIDRVFEKLNFSYSVSASDRANIPASGRVIVIANHPIGSLDGLALLHLVGQVRQDVRIIANDMLSHFRALEKLLIHVDVLSGGSAIGSFRQVVRELEQEHAVIVFPAGEVSRAGPLGVRDHEWRGGFLHFARKAHAPLLPVRIQARNSWFFYGASMLYKPLSTMLLSDEMFKQQDKVISFHIGETIPCRQLQSVEVRDRPLVRRLRKHVYKLGRSRRTIFETERTVAHPENRQLLQQELKRAQLLGATRDSKAIYLFDWFQDSAVIREIGRLRELAFRRAGEGTGKRRDLDHYDQYYRHLVLWDRDELEIAGAYRIGECARILQERGPEGLYTASLYEFTPEFLTCLSQGVELGRSFVNPRYWGSSCLDYLWQGIGAWLAHNPHIRYLFGPVSMSTLYPERLREELVYYFSTYYPAPATLATARHPFHYNEYNLLLFRNRYKGLDRNSAFTVLHRSFEEQGFKIPVLYKQYAALFEEGGFQSLVFSTDPDFADCLDGLCLTDIGLLKADKRKRYIRS